MNLAALSLREQTQELHPARLREDAPGLQAASLETLRQMIAAGTGVSLMPQLAIQRWDSPRPPAALCVAAR